MYIYKNQTQLGGEIISIFDRWEMPAFMFLIYSEKETVGKRLQKVRDILISDGYFTEKEIDRLAEMYMNEPDVMNIPEPVRDALREAEATDFMRWAASVKE